MAFTGFPERLLDFYEGLEADNSKAYWQNHRGVYDEAVATPLRALLDALEPEFGDAGQLKVFRPYRDVRFSKDKTPYKTAAAAVLGDHAHGGLYLQVSARGLMVAGGSHVMTTDQARRLRAAVAADRSGAALVRLLDDLRGAGFHVEAERLKRVPKEFPPDHPRAGLLTLKTLTAVQEHEPHEWLHTPEAAQVVAEGWRRLRPLIGWLREHVGASRT